MRSCLMHAALLKLKTDTLSWFAGGRGASCSKPHLTHETTHVQYFKNLRSISSLLDSKGKLVATQKQASLPLSVIGDRSVPSHPVLLRSVQEEVVALVWLSGSVSLFGTVAKQCWQILTKTDMDFLCFYWWKVSSNLFIFYPVTLIQQRTLFFFNLVKFKHLHKHPVHLPVPSLVVWRMFSVPFRFKFHYSACKSLTWIMPVFYNYDVLVFIKGWKQFWTQNKPLIW